MASGPPTPKPKGDYLKGRFVRARRPDAVVTSLDPGDTSRPPVEFPVDASAPERALEAAREAQPAWGAMPAQARVAALQKLRAELRNRGEDLVATLSMETGRPLWETRAEVRSMYGVLDGVFNQGLAEVQPRHAGGSELEFHPLGAVAVLAPYSQPCLLLHADATAALAAGCTVVCKPSEHTPASAQLYAEIVHEADLPRGVFNLVQGDWAVGAALAGSALVDGVLFSGSESSGRRLLAATAGAGDRVVRVLASGHAAALVLDDANLDEAAYKIVIGACTGSGQRCTSTRRVVVHRRVADALVAKLRQLLEHVQIGHGSDPASLLGPLISEDVVLAYLTELKRVSGHAAEALVAGGKLTARRPGHYVRPALFRTDGEGLAAIASQESIGPILSLAVVEDLDEGLELALASPFGLTMSVFCRSARELALVRERQTCALCLHNLPTTKWPTKLPVVPRGRSGNGLPAGTATVRTCTRMSVNLASETALDLTMLPPGLPRL